MRLGIALFLLLQGAVMGQDFTYGAASAAHGIRLRTRTVSRAQPGRPSRGISTRIHLIAETDGKPLDVKQLAERGVRVLGSIPDNGVAISAAADDNLSDLGFRWIGVLEAADRRGFPDTAATSTDDAPAYYVVQFYSDVDMGDARSLVTGIQAEIRDNPSLLATQLLVRGTHAQMLTLSEYDSVVYIFPASDELVQGNPVTACVSGSTSYGAALPIAASLSGGWSANEQGTANITYSFGPMTGKMPADTIRQLFTQAQQQWASLVKVVFTETSNRTAPRNVDLGFYTGGHGDPFPFDGAGGVLAHTFYPAPPNAEPVAGDMHMDADESWSNSGSGTDFYSVTLHELGHALGLGHSNGPADVMYPFYRHNVTFSPNDIAAIQALYVARDTAPPPAAPLVLMVRATTPQVAAATIALAGSTSGGQGAVRVTWVTDRGGLGTAQGSATWTVAAVPLAVGRNVITVTAQDEAAAVVMQTVVVERASTAAPLILTVQAMAAQVTAATIALAGSTGGGQGAVRVNWVTDRGGLGTALGSANWAVAAVPLAVGRNVITVTAQDEAAAVVVQTVAVERVTTVAPTPPAPVIQITSPSDGALTTALTAIVRGTAVQASGIQTVSWRVSGGAAGVAQGTGSWDTGAVVLQAGVNTITIYVVAMDGGTASKSLQITVGAPPRRRQWRTRCDAAQPDDSNAGDQFLCHFGGGGDAVGNRQRQCGRQRGAVGNASGRRRRQRDHALVNRGNSAICGTQSYCHQGV